MGSMAEPDAIAKELLWLQQDYLRALPSKVDHLTSLHRALMEGDGDEQVVTQYVFQVHKLAGSAALYGLDNVSEVAKQMENALLSFQGDPKDLPHNLVASLEGLMHDLLSSVPPPE